MKQLGGAGAILAVVIALLAAACGGTSNAANEDPPEAASSTSSATPPRKRSTRRSSGLREDPRGQGRQLQQLLRRLRRPEPRGRGRPARRRRPLRPGRDMERLVEEGLVAKDWDKQPYDGIAQDSVVVITVRKGNPEGIKSFDDLLSQASTSSPQPVQLRRRALEHHGRLRHPDQRGQVARRGARRRRRALQERRRSRAAPATRSPPSPRARATSCSATRTRRSRPKEGEDVEYVVPP